MTSTTGGRPPAADLDNAKWFKSTMSSANGGCLEVAHLNDGRVAVRDTEDPGNAPFVLSAFVWDCFLDGARKGEFDRPTA